LPEQEEIEFVTKISDMFEETIKKLYNKANWISLDPYHN
jgi:hypothetical protein